jgi:hypothetical protein
MTPAGWENRINHKDEKETRDDKKHLFQETFNSLISIQLGF